MTDKEIIPQIGKKYNHAPLLPRLFLPGLRGHEAGT